MKTLFLAFFIACIVCQISVKGQEKPIGFAEQLFAKNHFTLYTTIDKSAPYILQQSGLIDVKPTSTGLEAGFKYTINFGGHFGIETGLGLGSQNYYFASKRYNPGLYNSSFALAYLQAPLILKINAQFNKKLIFFCGTGIVFKVFDLTDGISASGFGDGATHEFSGSEISFQSMRKEGGYILSAFEMGALYRISSKSHNMIRVNIDFQASPQATTLINYTLTNDNQQSVGNGKFYATVGYVGVCMGYVFTNGGKN